MRATERGRVVASIEMSRLVRFPSLLLVLALGLSSLACFPHYQVISKSGPPSALVGLGAVWVQYDYSHVAISDKRMTEEQWLASREKDEHRQTYLETKDSANVGFAEGLAKGLAGVQINPGQAPAGAIQITVTFTEWEEGMYAAVVAWPSKATARVIFTRDGQTLDEIEVRSAENASLYTPAPQQRLHTVGQRLGQYAAEYVRAAAG
jgi:hypothetical protein